MLEKIIDKQHSNRKLEYAKLQKNPVQINSIYEHNIVYYQNYYYAIPYSCGNVDLINDDISKNSDIVKNKDIKMLEKIIDKQHSILYSRVKNFIKGGN